MTAMVAEAETPAAAGGLHRICRTCELPFTVTAAEQTFLRTLAAQRNWRRLWFPFHCLSCRMYRRLERYEARDDGRDDVLVCAVCAQRFPWSAEEKRFYAGRGFSRPRRCRTCRHPRSSGPRQIEVTAL